MLSERSVTLLGSNLIFLAVAASLYLLPGWGVALFPFFVLICLWTDFRGDEELRVIFLFMIGIAALILASTASEGAFRAGLLIELAGIVLAGSGLGLHRGLLARERQRVTSRGQELDRELRDLERDLRFYSGYESAAAAQIHLRRTLTEAARSLGATLDPNEVQSRLARIVQERYPGLRVRIIAGQPPDPLIAWTAGSGRPLLVLDVEKDPRFSGGAGGDFRSAVVAPMLVMKQPFGFLRVDSPEPSRFKPEDLQAVDLFATMASLGLENIQFFQNVNQLATHDALTQLHTHRAFQTRLQEEILRAGRSQAPVALVMCDVDHFKRYNDAYGHQAGDLLLRTVAGILVHQARAVDFVARYGGEEFVLLLPGCGRGEAAGFAERLRSRLAEEPFLFQGRPTGVTASFGAAAFPEDATTPSQLVRAADERLYKAKEGGRNRVVG